MTDGEINGDEVMIESGACLKKQFFGSGSYSDNVESVAEAYEAIIL